MEQRSCEISIYIRICNYISCGLQLFKLDLVLMSIVILCILAALMYQGIALAERRAERYKISPGGPVLWKEPYRRGLTGTACIIQGKQ